MKYIKLFMLLTFVSLFAACSSDDDYNTKDATISFASATITTKESAGMINIPVNITGARNGNVSFVIQAEEVGDNPAKEDVNYMITDKTLNLVADTLESGVVNVETKIIDDDDLNADRTFKLTIVSANGAKIGENASTVVTIRDNESAIYEQFFGTWKLTGTLENSNGTSEFSKDVTITGETDEDNPDYNNILTASSTAMLNVGVNLDCDWHFRYSFNQETKQGTLGFICGEVVSTYGNSYQWVWATDDGTNLTTDDVTTPWKLTDNNKLPNEISFPEESSLYLYQPGAGYWAVLYNLKLIKK